MSKVVLGVIGTVVAAGMVWCGAFMGDAVLARADMHWHTVAAFQSYQQAVVRQDAQKELRALEREIADVQYQLAQTNISPELRGRLQERLRILTEQRDEIQHALANGETG